MRDKPLGADELSVLLKYFILGRIEQESGAVHELRADLRGENAQLFLTALARRIGRIVDEFDGRFFTDLISHPQVDIPRGWPGRLLSEQNQAARRFYLQRIAQLALEQIRGERCAPELRVEPLDTLGGAQLTQRLPGTHTHAVIFGEFSNFTNELFPLILDAYVHDQEKHGRITINVVGVHIDWLTAEGEATRVIYYEHAEDVLREVSLAKPLDLASVQFLCLGRDHEHALHQALSEKFRDKALVNPYPASATADDKFRTYSLLVRSGIPTPRTCLIRKDDPLESIKTTLGKFSGEIDSAEVVVQPNTGTEGEGVSCFAIEGGRGAHVVKHIISLQDEYGDVIIRERVGNVDYHDGRNTFSADLRINVSWDGERHSAESGYLQVASEPGSAVSSVGRGGRIIKLSEGAIENLGLTPDELGTVKKAAAEAAGALGLPLAGIDIRLERTESELIPWVLDVNPRSAGLSYSEMLDTCEPGVSKNIWTWLTSRPSA